jgi:tellurite resistance protein TerC
MIFKLPVKPRKASASLRGARKVIVAVVGSTVLAIGVALIVLPGPAVIVIPAGLTILATEFVWARRLLRRFKDDAGRLLKLRKTHDTR